MSINVVIIEDDELYREGLCGTLNSFAEFRVIASFPTCNIAEYFAKDEVKSTVEMIVASPPSDFNIYIKMLETLRPFSVMILSNILSEQRLIRAIEYGISDFYPKKILKKELQQILLEMKAGHKHNDIKMNTGVEYVSTKNSLEGKTFTEQEFEVLDLVCEQNSSIEIAEILDVSVRTIESRKRNMMQKTNSKNMVGVVVIYMKYLSQINS